ncbi:type II toxin-antitoxin system RelE/ParE family toxin [Aquimarina sp. U1-2]|uniref:type II toxin-antitoxin system RelE/ParE family toxin n=1 Tax=Aquimarina sp. U1-2 TaxID=2823141 RepID=UPI001AEC94BB|nr:type II toxin-antitoxin system RelE/ParE family toxin [Aquimarina sp. U1-2]MBP2833564.1 type II toxin-antitoxin system RelE/ParE family toxin [Aquimarina sp. U1-2]
MTAIIWSSQASLEYWNNINYLLEEWTIKDAAAFVDKVEELIEQVKTGNIIFKPTNREDIYHVVVVKQITLFYEVQADTITLLRFWNNYQDPQKLTF